MYSSRSQPASRQSSRLLPRWAAELELVVTAATAPTLGDCTEAPRLLDDAMDVS
ncbi:hypothetical protein AB0H36_46410 [Kribbella sp. NPDC050820]|uniref:hypothetical protein n=1 Tax=Kribbella sp. NPDC050820 TaxID=3155408 RepID=UPI0033CCC156